MTHSNKVLGGLIIAMLFMAGCSQTRSAVLNDKGTDAGIGKQPISQVDETKKEDPKTVPPEAEVVKEKQVQAIGESSQPSDTDIGELPDELQNVYFAFDSYAVDEKAKPIIKRLVSVLEKKLPAQLIIEGHCDERDTAEYNLALGDKRANAVRDYLTALGIASGNTETISYGKEQPVCSEHSEECWAKNRRVHFLIINKRM